MITDEQIRLFSQYCSENFGTELKSVRKSERYQSLPICVLDCVYSLRTKYFAVTVPVLQRYADTYMGGNLYAGQDTLSDFITHIKEFSDCSEFAKTVLKNNQVLSGRNKAGVCYEIATKLHELLNMDTFDDFRNFEKEALLEIVLRSVRGMGDAGVKYGVPRKQAYEMVSQMIIGSAKLQLETGEHPGVLKDNVCSPAGTTICGVDALAHAGIRAGFIDAIDAIMNK